jgi:hypothetical protein
MLHLVGFYPARIMQGISLATEPDVSLIILTPLKILQRNLNRTTCFPFTFLTQWVKSASNFVAVSSISGKIIKEMSSSVASGTPCTMMHGSTKSKFINLKFFGGEGGGRNNDSNFCFSAVWQLSIIYTYTTAVLWPWHYHGTVLNTVMHVRIE